MVGFPTVRVAAIQATPAILDAEASVDKAVALLADAADQGVQVAVLPETFVPLYPSNAWARQAAAFSRTQRMLRKREENIFTNIGRQVHEIICGRDRFLPLQR